MYKLIDTHCHIHDRESYDFMLSRQQVSKKALRKNPEIPHLSADFSPEKILTRANAMDIGRMITVGTSLENSLLARQFAENHENIYWSFGIHPDEAESSDADIEHIMNLISGSHPVAIGEVGLDYRNGTKTRKKQIELFEKMLELAKKLDLPLIFHVREAFDDFFPIIDNAGIKRAVVHSFSDSPENLEKSLSRDFYIGVNGLATFADLPLPPIERTLLETDAPFLAPTPVRGRVNEPAYVRYVAEFLAAAQHIDLAKVADQTTKNAETLFGLLNNNK